MKIIRTEYLTFFPSRIPYNTEEQSKEPVASDYSMSAFSPHIMLRPTFIKTLKCLG